MNVKGTGPVKRIPRPQNNPPPQTFLQCFTRLTLPAWKLPETRQVHVRIPSGDQVATITKNKTGSDFNNLHAAPSLFATSDRRGTSCKMISSDIAGRRDFLPCSRSPQSP